MIPPEPGTPRRPDPTRSCDVVDQPFGSRFSMMQPTIHDPTSNEWTGRSQHLQRLNGFERPESFSTCCVSELELPSFDTPTDEDACPPPPASR